MPAVSLDTSALMLPVELDIDVFDELERLLGEVSPLVATPVMAELDRLADGGGRPGRAARVGRGLAEARCTVVDADAETADDAVLAIATEGEAAYVVTADRDLARRAREAAIPAITPRGRRQLVVQPP